MPGEAEAFIRKPEYGDSDDVSLAVRAAQALIAVCISYGASILGPATAAQTGKPTRATRSAPAHHDRPRPSARSVRTA